MDEPVGSYERMTLPDGRELWWGAYGDPDGLPMIAFHGTPGSHVDFAWAHEMLRERGIRMLAPDRPGHGQSSDNPGWAMPEHAADVEALADHLALDRFSLLGFSGGGPYSLATAVHVPDRIEHLLAVSCAGRMDIPGAYQGVSLGDRQLTWVAMNIPRLGRWGLGAFARVGRRAPHVPWLIWFSDVKGADREVLSSFGPPRQAMASFYEAFRQGASGVIRDFQVLTLPFGFDLADVPGKVWMWHGDADSTVPLHQARDLANHIPGAVLHIVPGAGHLMIRSHLDHILDTVGL